MNYGIYSTEEFDNKIGQVEKSVRKGVDKAIRKKLATNPKSGAGNIGHLKGEYRGLRRLRVGRDWRIYFAICEECRELGYTQILGCVDCNEKPDKSIVLFYLVKKG